MMPMTTQTNPIVPIPPDTTLSYDQSNQLMNDLTFRGRVKVAGLKYADSISNEANAVPAHNTRLKWAMNMMQNPDTMAGQLQSPVVMDAAVQADGSAITDAALQGSVEAVVNKLM